MSSYSAKAFNLDTGRVEAAQFIDDYFGSHQYGVTFDGLRFYTPGSVDVEKAGEEIARIHAALIAERDELLQSFHQIKAVCEDNFADACNHKAALKFVESVIHTALAKVKS